MGPEDPPLRYFTPDEANAALPEARRLLEQSAELLEQLEGASARARAASNPALRLSLEERRDTLNQALMGCLDRLRRRGVEVKGVKAGLLDFPALRNGQRVLLCWRAGEAKIDHWHPIHTGYAGRRRIDDEAASWEWRN